MQVGLDEGKNREVRPWHLPTSTTFEPLDLEGELHPLHLKMAQARFQNGSSRSEFWIRLVYLLDYLGSDAV